MELQMVVVNDFELTALLQINGRARGRKQFYQSRVKV